MLSYKKFFTLAVVMSLSALLGTSARAEPSQDRVRERLVLVIHNAVTINAFDDMQLSLSKLNRDHIAEVPFTAYDRLNTAIARLDRSFSNAYGRTLTITPESLGEIRITQITKEKIIARITNAGGQEIEIHLAAEAFTGNPWRIELDAPTADLLADALSRQCTALAATPWPRDPDAGRRIIAQRILAAMTQPPTVMTLQQTDAK